MIKETERILYRTEVITDDSTKSSLVFKYKDDEIISIRFIGENETDKNSGNSFIIDGYWNNESLVHKFVHLMKIYFEEKHKPNIIHVENKK